MAEDRYSQIYLERGKPTKDSERFRNRLAAYHDQRLLRLSDAIISRFELKTGAIVPWNVTAKSFSMLLRKGQLRDVLDAITSVYEVLHVASGAQAAEGWRGFVAIAMHEENVGYRVDDRCVAHYHVDEEFERNRASALAALSAEHLANVRAAFDDAYRHLDAAPPDTKAAVRSIFESVEVLARLILPEAKNLNRWMVENTLKAKCLEVAPADVIERKTLEGLFAGLADWADALHNYRHGQPEADPVAPSEELAVYALSTGAAHLRMLAGCYARMPKPGPA